MGVAFKPPRTTKHLEQLQAVVRGEAPEPPIARLIGFSLTWEARLRATARVTKRTRGLVECNVEDDGGSLVAKVFSTCMVLRGAEAQGR